MQKCAKNMSKVRYKMPRIEYFLVLISLGAITSINGFTLSPGDKEIAFSKVKDGYYTLTLDENLENKVLFNIEGVSGELRLEIDKECSDLVYGAKVQEKQCILTQLLDYEKSACRDTKNTLIDVSGGRSITFEVKVNNLDDNAPQFHLGSNNCKFEENTIYVLENSDCSLAMTDLDGMMDKAKLTIKEGNSTIFGVDFYPQPNPNDTTANVVIYLQNEVTLDYETRYSYVLVVKAQEEIESGEVQVAIDVGDQPDQPPKFTKMITTEQFEENEDQQFQVTAVDGDVGIDSAISYKITKNGCAKFECDITISETGGVIEVKNVDREKTGDTIALTIEAIEEDDNSATPLDITFFIIDQDDEWPVITMKDSIVSVDEGFKGIITKFSVEDMDLSDNGTFTIKMDAGNGEVNYTQAFEMIPDTGYQTASFSLTVIDSSLLDYEDDDWKVIKFNILAIEKADKTHTDSKLITINLKDINDEPPIFVNEEETVDIPENIEAGQIVFNATAVDKDAGDIVSYEIVGIWNQKLDISKEGIITTINDNTFDYEVQQQVVIAVKASDNGKKHVTSKTITIDITDIDDEPPVMKITISTDDRMAKVPENSKPETEIEGVSIVVTDPDTNPQLNIEIDWKGTYVTKNSRMLSLDPEVYQCFSVKSKSTMKQKLEASISINDKCSPDFEIFDAIVIGLKATDKNTEIGDDSTKGTVLINIVDLNDNVPRFIDSSLQDLTVTDGTKTKTKIGVISAVDEDIGTDLTFTIKPHDTDTDWVDINEATGELTVKDGVEIDDDIPPRKYIYFDVTVHDPDPEHDNTTKISIYIEDINDQYPKIVWTKEVVEIEELSKQGTVLTKLDSKDADRDDPFNKVIFKFDTNITMDASNRFDISEDGSITVLLRNGAELNRDVGPASFVLPILAFDNPKGTLQLKDHFDLTVNLKDLDNHVPIITTSSFECLENLDKDETIGEIIAYDPDQEGPNSNVFFSLISVLPLETRNKNKLDTNFFIIEKTSAKKATLKLIKPLKGYWGSSNLTVQTSDEGNPKKFINNDITLKVEKFNFKQPVFEFPKEDHTKITIDKDLTNIKSEIILADGNTLNNFNVNDLQDHKWDVTFTITDENGGPAEMFRIVQASENSWEGTLQLIRKPSDTEANQPQSVNIKASVKEDMKTGEALTFVETTVDITFFSFSDQPIFNKTQDSILIKENFIGSVNLDNFAYYPSISDLKPYYFLVGYSDIFICDVIDGRLFLTLLSELDYEEQKEYEVLIVANNKNFSPSVIGNETNVLHLTINVEDMNDHEPVFHPSKFTAAFLRTYSKDTKILTVNATDADPTLQTLEFSLDQFECSEKLKAPEVPFMIGKLDGTITNQFTVTSDMSGYCSFLVMVQDQADSDNHRNNVTTTVQINVISSDMLVKFTFMNPDWYVNQEMDNVTSTIDEAFEEYGYKCYLADLSYDADWHNTTAHFYFINKKLEPVLAEEILGNLTDPNKYSTLTKALEVSEVHLYYFSEETEVKVADDYLKIWMIVTIIVLGALLTLITIIFFIRNRALTRRINNLSTTKFGSQDSGLNRAGVTAPTTNRNAIEGSNPVFSSENYIKEVEDDRHSVLSGDSDLLGVENSPDFDF